MPARQLRHQRTDLEAKPGVRFSDASVAIGAGQGIMPGRSPAILVQEQIAARVLEQGIDLVVVIHPAGDFGTGFKFKACVVRTRNPLRRTATFTGGLTRRIASPFASGRTTANL